VSAGSEWIHPIPFGKPAPTNFAHGFGSVYEDRTRGRWVGSVELARQRHEPRRRKCFTGSTRAIVEAKLSAYRETFPAPEFLGREAYMEQARALGTHTDSEWWALVRSVKKVCHYCGITTEAVWVDKTDPHHLEKDHLIPVSRGGSDAIDNIVVSCGGCNSEKGTMTADEYRAWRARQ
jgi:5-methylcytosine-specific restriction endonuclease McrA